MGYFQYCLVEHFTTSPLPKLCSTSSRNWENNIQKLPSSNLDMCRSLKSFRHYVEGDVKERAVLLTDDRKFRKFLTESLRKLDETTERFKLLVLCLNELVKNLPGKPYGTQVSM